MGFKKAKSWTIIVTTLSGIMACGTERVNRLDFGNIGKMDVRDATLKAAPGGAGNGAMDAA